MTHHRCVGFTTLHIIFSTDNTFIFTTSSTFSMFNALGNHALCNGVIDPRVSN